MNHHTITIVLSALLIASCSSSTEREINHVAQQYLDATSAYDVDKSCQYCTPETAEGLHAVEIYIMPMLDSSVIAQNTPAKNTIKATLLTSDTTAEVTFHKKTPIDESDGTLKMVKRDGQWMAHAPMSIPGMLRNGREHTFNYDSIGELSVSD